MHTSSALSPSLTFTAMDGGPKEDTVGVAVEKDDIKILKLFGEFLKSKFVVNVELYYYLSSKSSTNLEKETRSL